MGNAKIIFQMFSLTLRRFYGTLGSKLRHVAVVGSGPAGFYLSQQILKQKDLNVQIDLYEKLPVPFGLVRYGVAPDHPEVKNVEGTFTKVAQDPRVQFLGNVTLGQDVKTKELMQNYDAVVLAYGAAKDRTLGIPGESSKNVISARNFVGFYNGLPEDRNLDFNLDTDHAVVIGLGNVAIDVARVLCTPIDELAKTDITEAALEKLSNSRIKKVTILGRRGPLNVAFTIKELRELIHLKGCKPSFDLQDFPMSRDVTKTLQRPRKRLTELLFKSVLDPPTQKQLDLWGSNPSKEWKLQLLRTPKEIHADLDDNVTGLTVEINQLKGLEDIQPTGNLEKIDCGLILRSIGYFAVPVEDGIPYDAKSGIVPNVEGRVTGENGLYCAGWLATGPRGVIVDTMTEAFKVGQTVSSDLKMLPNDHTKQGFASIQPLLEQRNVRPVSFHEWETINDSEKNLGKPSG